MTDELVRYSRAGDVFHYRWAARRCLNMIYPNSNLLYVNIEGSQEKKISGEYIIDVAEYYDDGTGQAGKIKYYQLKHTTVRKDNPFKLSDIKSTIQGFADRFRALSKDMAYDGKEIGFAVITNRHFSASLKENIQNLIAKKQVSKQFKTTLESYTNLSGEALRNFCKSLVLDDSEGDYQHQKIILQQETSKFMISHSLTPQIDSIVALIQEKALPDNDGKITPQEILQKFGVTSERDLFPAPSRIDYQNKIIVRKTYKDIIETVFDTAKPSVIHASGGIGKTVCAIYLSRQLPCDSIGILYDCFGAGSYRNRSTTRHRHHDALIQIINELAIKGLCEPIVADINVSTTSLMRAFHHRIEAACVKLQQTNNNAKLVLIIDAADNAELAAKEFSENCFVHELLMESYPNLFKLIMLCRTERITLVDPENRAHHIELEEFCLDESTKHLQSFYPNATIEDAQEFHCLTSANPRVQINALSAKYKCTKELLSSFGASPIGVEAQIQEQLNVAIQKIKRAESKLTQEAIDSVCTGLATLPPFIPLGVLSKAADVPEAMIKSLIADIGRPLWLVDNYAVQFRDEPTETWFRDSYAASKEQIEGYIHRLRPLAESNVYVSETLPALYLSADMYEELVGLALSNDELPSDNPTISRNIRVYRLQFALKAALKLGRYDDAVKLALIAGEETAGKTRQIELLSKNIDLIKPLQSKDEIQALAYRRTLKGNWNGSENLYAASLLSTDSRLTGEARNLLRAALEWLNLYFHDVKKDQFYTHLLTDEEVGEFAYAINNIHGTDRAISFLCNGFRSSPWINKISRVFIKRLIDAGDDTTINKILNLDIHNVYFLTALADELLKIGRFPVQNLLNIGLILLIHKRTKIKKITHYTDAEDYIDSLISFLEACAKQGMPTSMILRAMKIYFNDRASNTFTSDIFRNERAAFLRIMTLKSKLQNSEIDINDLMPSEWGEKKKKHDYDSEIRDFTSKISSLLPWYQLRINTLLGTVSDFRSECRKTHESTKKIERWRFENYDPIPYEIYHAKVSILALCRLLPLNEIETYYNGYLSDTKDARISDLINIVRITCRNSAYSSVSHKAEITARNLIMGDYETETETKLDNLVMLARAVYSNSPEDAAAYFNQAVELASRFGDEIVQRWEAVTALAKKTYRHGYHNDNLAYRYIRCAELVGENVAREKYWNRDEAISTCVNLSPFTAIAAFSRWRDREVGRFYLQIHSLAYELVLNGHATPMHVWPLTAFYEDYHYVDLIVLCIDKEKNVNNKQFILDSAVFDMRIAEYSGQEWNRLKETADKNNLKNEQLNYIIEHYSSENLNHKTHSDTPKYTNPILLDLDSVFDGVDLMSQSGISDMYQRVRSVERHIHRDFLDELFVRIPQQNLTEFLHLFLDSEYVDIYDAVNLMAKIKYRYGDKFSVQREWGKYLYKFGHRFPSSLVSFHSFEHYTKDIIRNKDDLNIIKCSIIKGFSDHATFSSAETCFGFISNVVEFITEEQAENLLDYALARFELYIDNDFGDGPYENNQLPLENTLNALAGFIWCALGSPHSTTRWKAAHAVRKFADAKCQDIIDLLIAWMKLGKVGVYGYNGYPFYFMHAKLYLLISLWRITVDDASMVYGHKQIIEEIIIKDPPHILMQKISSDICLAIENQYPGTYQIRNIEQFKTIAKSLFPIESRSKDGFKKSYLHEANLIDIPEGYHHGFFMQEDWFKPLGNVFNISADQIDDLATDILINDWSYPFDDRYDQDPRIFQWQRGSLTHHSHGTYPRSDDYRFYLSYHAMLGVAAKLLKNMPAVQRFNDEDPWEYWFSWHYLTRNDGKWVSDRKDPPPLRQHDFDGSKTNWETAIDDDMFFNGLINEHFYGSFITVYGWWEDGNASLSETYSISSAFVPTETTDALVHALASFDSPHDYRLPNYLEVPDEDEDDIPIDDSFAMQGWIVDPDSSKKIDEYDPFAADISYPPYEIGEMYADHMHIKPDLEHRCWHDKDTCDIKALCEAWCSNVDDPMKDVALRKGMRIGVRLDSLSKLCRDLDKNLLLEVTLKHSLKRRYDNYDESREYRSPEARLYIICKNGLIRQCASIGKNNSSKPE